MPAHILEELRKRRVVIFAGAGVSTENKLVLPFTLYEDVRGELGIKPETDISFSQLMTQYCSEVNGRSKLLRKIRERFEHIKSFPELYRRATRFHCELGTLYFIDIIITTNWDDYFECESGAIPFVSGKDFAFWNVEGRKVFKIHGSVNNYGSLILTSQDYKKCYKNLKDGVLGSTIRNLLATKTVIYVGYSFGDEDFKKIHGLLKREMGSLLPRGYIITPERSNEEHFEKLGLTHIKTDATHFISVVKKHLVENGFMIDDQRFEGVEVELLSVMLEHDQLYRRFDCRKHPDIIFAGCYQDELIHAFERMLALKKTGYYSHKCNVLKAVEAYTPIRKEKLQKKRYEDVAYIDGYVNGLLFLLAEDGERKLMPRYYVYGVKDEPRSFSHYIKARRKAVGKCRFAHRHAEKVVQVVIGGAPGMVYHHRPTLL